MNEAGQRAEFGDWVPMYSHKALVSFLPIDILYNFFRKSCRGKATVANTKP